MSPYRLLHVVALAASLSFAALAHAEELAVEGETVELAAIIPALLGTELGSMVVADSPLPGESSVLRASDIKAMLKASGTDTRGLSLPRSVRLVRRARTVKDVELTERVRAAVAPQISPCEMISLSTLPPVSLGAGDYEVVTQTNGRRDSGRVQLVIMLKQGPRSQRISAQLELSCPAPVVHPGAIVRLVVVKGAVRVSAPAVAHQPGRVGDEIRITNQITKRQLRARVLDGQTVEVVQ